MSNVQSREKDGFIHALVRSSSNVREIHYNIEEKELDIVFQKPKEEVSRTYRYSPVPREVVTRLLNADSTGKFINDNLAGVYHVEKIDG